MIYNILRAHESEINEIAEEMKMSLGGPLDLVSRYQGKKPRLCLLRMKLLIMNVLS